MVVTGNVYPLPVRGVKCREGSLPSECTLRLEDGELGSLPFYLLFASVVPGVSDE